MNKKLIYYKISKDIENEKPWLVIVHGFFGHHKEYDGYIRSFVDGYNILLINLYGHGDSFRTNLSYNYKEYSKDIMILLNELNIASCYFWGIHMGTGVGLYLSSIYPEFVKKMILEEPCLPNEYMPSLEGLVKESKLVIKNRYFLAPTILWRAFGWSYLNKTKLKQERRYLNNELSDGSNWEFQLKDRLDSIKTETIIINGAKDYTCFKKVSKIINKKLENCSNTTIYGAKNFPLIENNLVMKRIVHNFLNNIKD